VSHAKHTLKIQLRFFDQYIGRYSPITDVAWFVVVFETIIEQVDPGDADISHNQNLLWSR